MDLDPNGAGAFRRVMLKLSGEVLAGEKGIGVDPLVVRMLARQIAAASQSGVQIAVVVGGGNYFRGRELSEAGMDRETFERAMASVEAKQARQAEPKAGKRWGWKSKPKVAEDADEDSQQMAPRAARRARRQSRATQPAS